MPDWKPEIRKPLSNLKLEPARELEIVEEVSQHLDDRYDELLNRGASKEEAMRLVLMELNSGNLFSKELKRAERQIRREPVVLGIEKGNLMENFTQDLRYGLRMLRKNPGFTAIAVLTLALGIGANTAIFSLINAALLRQLPFPNADRLTAIWASDPLKPGFPQFPPANADVAEWRNQSNAFASIAAFAPRTADLTDGGDPERFGAAAVTAGFFETLGIVPILGRPLTLEEEMPGGPPVVLIGYGLWQRRFGGDRDLLGKGISVNGEKRTVIGILPPEFDFPRAAEWPAFFPFANRTEVWFPLGLRAVDDGSGWSNWQSLNERGLIVIGRLKPDVNPRQAQSEMDAFAARQAKDHPGTHKDILIKLVPLREQMAGKSHNALLILFAAVGLLLLIACVNVANLLLARGAARQQEMAVRAAMGAARKRLIRQLLAEGILLALFGSGFGVLIAFGCLKAFLALNPLPLSRLDEASIDPVVLSYAAFIALATSVLFGLVPALQTSRFDLRKSLDEGARGEAGSVRGHVRAWLVGAEVALALVLLTTAGLMLRSFLHVLAVEPGFRSDSVLAFDVQPSGARYQGEAGATRFYQELTERFETLPGVRSAGAISYLPLGGGENMGSFTVENEAPPAPGNQQHAERRWVTPGYFATMQIPIRQGRVFTPNDSIDQPKVVVINQALAKRFFTSGDPIGRRLKAGGHWRTVVGVVSDVKSGSLERETGPQLYFPHAQDPWPPMTVVVRTETDPLILSSAIRAELKQIGPLLVVAKMRTMEQVMSNASSARRFNMALLAFFAIAALFLTTMGIYGVVAFFVGRRRREIGIRMALGAQPSNVLRIVLQQGMRPVFLGSVAGLVGSLAASRLVANQLFGVSATDPLTLTSIIALFLLTALIACWLPARRASKVDPMIALRYE